MENTVRRTKRSVILRKERVALWVNPEKPGNEERTAGSSLKRAGLSIGKRILKWCWWQAISSVLESLCSGQSTEMWERERRTASLQLEEGIPDLRRCRQCCQASQGSMCPQLPTTPQAFNVPSQGREAGGRRGVCGQELAPVSAPCSGHCSHSSASSLRVFTTIHAFRSVAGLVFQPCLFPATSLFDNPALELPRFPPCPLPRARVTGSQNQRQQRGRGAGQGSNVCRRWSPAPCSPKEN